MVRIPARAERRRRPHPTLLLALGLLSALAVAVGSASGAAQPKTMPASTQLTAALVDSQSVETDVLRVTVRYDGAMGLWRRTPTGWVRQIFGEYSKGSRLELDGLAYGTPSGTFNMSVDNGAFTVVSNQRVDACTLETVYEVPGGGIRITQRVELYPGRDYYDIRWAVANRSSATRRSLRFIHGADTWFNNDDYGEGHFDERSNKVIVTNISGGNVTGNPGTRGHMALSSPMTVSGHMEGHYYTVQTHAQDNAPTNDVDQTRHDAAYFLRWSCSTLRPGETWLIRAREEVVYGQSEYSVPVMLISGYRNTLSYENPGSNGLPYEWAELLARRGRIVFAAPAGDGTVDWEIDSDGGLQNNGWRLEQFLNSGASPLLSDYGWRNFERIDVVAYSMGGLVAREYGHRAQYTPGATRFRRVVTLGTPHRGTYLTAAVRAYLGSIGFRFDRAATHDMIYPMSEFNRRTSDAFAGTQSPPLLVGAYPHDGFIWSSSSLYLPQQVYWKLPAHLTAHSDAWYFDGVLNPIAVAPYGRRKPIGGTKWATLRREIPGPDEVLPFLDYGTRPTDVISTGTGGGGGW